MLGSPENPYYRIKGVAVSASMLARLLACALRLLGATLRIRLRDDAGYLSGGYKGRYIFAFWHNRMFMLPIIHARFYKKRQEPVKGVAALTSASGEGTLLAQIFARFNLTAVRGSTSRFGTAALSELVDKIAHGFDVAVTPDGPRGPLYRLSPGVIFLAQSTGAAVLPVHVEYARCFRLKSWDRFMIPLPFSRVEVAFGPLFHAVSSTLQDATASLAEIMEPVTH